MIGRRVAPSPPSAFVSPSIIHLSSFIPFPFRQSRKDDLRHLEHKQILQNTNLSNDALPINNGDFTRKTTVTRQIFLSMKRLRPGEH